MPPPPFTPDDCPPHWHLDVSRAPARGCVLGLVLTLPLWGLLALGLWLWLSR